MRFVPVVLATSLLGAGCAPAAPAPDELADETSEVASSIGFDMIEPLRLAEPELTDEYVEGLIGTLDSLLEETDMMADSGRAGRIHLWRFATRMRTGSLTEEQAARAVAHLRDLGERYPDAAAHLEATSYAIENLRIGAIAPNIVAEDAYGETFELADYRGKVVVLYFTGQWCGPCRSEYPYQRLMTEVHANRPFAIVGVNSDSLAVARTYMAENNLEYRSFWDGPTTKGPVATRWNVTGWPTICVLDPEGRIRFTNVRHEDTLKAVAQLLAEIPREPPPERRASAEADADPASDAA